MIEVVQAGQAGKTSLLFDMHRMRKRIFSDRLRWDVTTAKDGLEIDQFDLPETVYLLALDEAARVVATWRLLPTSGPTMIRDVWPEFLETIAMPARPDVWEGSRFGAHGARGCAGSHTGGHLGGVSRATQELFVGLTELALMCGIREVYTMYDNLIARLLHRLDCRPRAVSAPRQICGRPAYVGAFRTDARMLARLRAATGITRPLLTEDALPPILLDGPCRAEWPRRTAIPPLPVLGPRQAREMVHG